MALKYLQGWRLPHFPEQPVQILDHLFHTEILPNVHSKPSLAQPDTVIDVFLINGLPIMNAVS